MLFFLRRHTDLWATSMIYGITLENWPYQLKLNIHISYEPAILFPNRNEYIHSIKIGTRMFTAALFIIALNWRLPKCPSAVEQVKKLWYIHTVKCFPVRTLTT